jgi:hypothetical protein
LIPFGPDTTYALREDVGERADPVLVLTDAAGVISARARVPGAGKGASEQRSRRA